MADYYEVLGIDRGADAHQIRSAYKRLAMQYHPDRNPDNKQAEEFFKIINEAYHVLSDPLKKSRYDVRFFSYHNTAQSTHAYWHEINRKKTFYRAQQQKTKRYTFDRSYYKIQGLSFLAFFIISGFCFAVIHTAYYFIEQNQARVWRINSTLLKEVNGLFVSGKFEEAFSRLDTIQRSNPAEYRFGFSRDSLVNELRDMADAEFIAKHYQVAARYYGLLKHYEVSNRLETLERLASCQYFMGNYKEALLALKHLHNQQPWNLELIYAIGLINFERLHNNTEALHYFTMGKRLFKKNLTEVYGKAFEIVMDPVDVPDVYFNIFEARGRLNIELGNYKEAITDFNWAVWLRPKNGKPYQLRIAAKIENHEYNGICDDILMAKNAGLPMPKKLEVKYCK